MGPLIKIVPEELNAVQKTDGWEKVKLYVDSGATETVVSDEMLTSIDTVEGENLRKGVRYEIANGFRIPNKGEKKFIGVSGEGCERGIVAQVADVNKGLLSVSRMVRSGHRVVFGDDSYIEDKATGERMWLEDEGGMFSLTLWVHAGGF